MTTTAAILKTMTQMTSKNFFGRPKKIFWTSKTLFWTSKICFGRPKNDRILQLVDFRCSNDIDGGNTEDHDTNDSHPQRQQITNHINHYNDDEDDEGG